ncbi:hypothetical protein [Kitasatospora purpeofusca]|uniref:hypothetical protein n=1 Tax=Kitasatospora purpeofusca TaxID=67352 RepID=UPI00386D2A19
MRIRTALINHAMLTPWPVDKIEHICPTWSDDLLYQRFIAGRPLIRVLVIGKVHDDQGGELALLGGSEMVIVSEHRRNPAGWSVQWTVAA